MSISGKNKCLEEKSRKKRSVFRGGRSGIAKLVLKKELEWERRYFFWRSCQPLIICILLSKNNNFKVAIRRAVARRTAIEVMGRTKYEIRYT